MAQDDPRGSGTMSPRVAEKRALKQNEIVVAATRLFNRRGFLATTMEQVAAAVGLNPATLYHYVQSKEELAYRAYLQTCERRRSQLEYANDPSLDGLDRVRRFLQSLGNEEHRLAILSEVGALSPAWASHIRRIQHGNVNVMQSMIAHGVADGSIVSDNPMLTGIAILGVVDWMSSWHTSRLPYTRRRIMTVIDDVLVNGMTPSSARPVKLPIVATVNLPAPTDPFDRKALGQARLEKFLQVAMESFNQVGVHATSIEQCAGRLHLTKGAFYYYFRNKEELLYLCYRRALQFDWQRRAPMAPGNAMEREILRRRALFERHAGPDGPTPTYQHVTFLAPLHHQEIVDELLQRRQREIEVVEQAMDRGEFRAMDAFLAVQVGSGLTSCFPTWYSAEGPASAATAADNHSELFLYGLKPRLA